MSCVDRRDICIDYIESDFSFGLTLFEFAETC